MNQDERRKHNPTLQIENDTVKGAVLAQITERILNGSLYEQSQGNSIFDPLLLSSVDCPIGFFAKTPREGFFITDFDFPLVIIQLNQTGYVMPCSGNVHLEMKLGKLEFQEIYNITVDMKAARPVDPYDYQF